MAHSGGVHIGKNSGVCVSVRVGLTGRVAVAVSVGVGVGGTFCQGINRQADSIAAITSNNSILRVCIRRLYIASGSKLQPKTVSNIGHTCRGDLYLHHQSSMVQSPRPHFPSGEGDRPSPDILPNLSA